MKICVRHFFNGLPYGYALTPPLFNIGLEYTIKN
jgi:hypothetical protein